MMKKYIFILIAVVSFSSCSVYETIVNVSRLKFKLDSVNNLNIRGVSFSDKDQFKDFNIGEIATLTAGLATGDLPVSFKLNIAADNPNDGSGGFPATDVTIKSFPWKLFLDDTETISGNISENLVVPGSGGTTMIPLDIQFDLLDFFKGNNIKSLVNLVLNMKGEGTESSNIKLFAQPVLGTRLGDLQYPNEIKIVDYEYN